jgi:hypothetical protein
MWWWRTATVAALALVVGCKVGADYANGFRCSDGECPAGQTCAEGVCVEPGTADDGSLPDTSDLHLDADHADAQADAMPEPADAAPDAALPLNMVMNPGTELGLTGWDSYQGTLRTSMTTPHSGAQCIVGCKDPTGSSGFFSVYIDVINGVPGDVAYPAHYAASIWVRASFMPGELAPPSLYLVLREGGGAMPDVDHAGPVVTPITTGWVQLTADAVIEQPDRRQLILIVWPGDVVDDTCFAVDDAYVGLLP